MRLLKAALAVLFLVTVAGCAAPSGTATPWITAYGCDPLIAMRFGKSC